MHHQEIIKPGNQNFCEIAESSKRGSFYNIQPSESHRSIAEGYSFLDNLSNRQSDNSCTQVDNLTSNNKNFSFLKYK
ncbi:MAG: hypothetical protein J0H68_04110 [Sphingobacteriia bacterium]|nr:hypothetical protein [Sphingobacteriia bacterium]